MYASLLRFFVFASVASFALLVSPSSALAVNMQCRCYATAAAPSGAVNGLSKSIDGTTYNFQCKKTYTTLGDDTNTDDYNKYVKIYFTDGTTGNKSIALKIRPRTSNCLMNVYDSNKKAIWTGSYCDTSDEKKFEPFPLKYSSGGSPADGTAGAQYTAAGAVATGASQVKNTLIGIYILASDLKYKIIAGCVED